jgi:arylsulfatase A
LELAGLKDQTPPSLDGISFAPSLLGGSQEERPFLYREFPAYGGQQCVRQGPWKLIRSQLMPKKKAAAAPTLELYDLAADLHEEHNVAADHPEIVAKLQRIAEAQHTPSQEFPFPALDQTGPPR